MAIDGMRKAHAMVMYLESDVIIYISENILKGIDRMMVGNRRKADILNTLEASPLNPAKISAGCASRPVEMFR